MLAIDWSTLADVATVVTGIVALVGSIAAIVTYHRSVQTKRAEWLASLHEKFFELDRYAQVRRVLDYQEEPTYSELASAVASGKHHPLADEFFRYLNFFEFLASLQDLGEIKSKEIIALFEYDLRLIQTRQFVVDVLEREGFERLPALLKLTRPLPVPTQ